MNKLSKEKLFVYSIGFLFFFGVGLGVYKLYYFYKSVPKVDETWIETVGTNLRPYSGRSSTNEFVFNVFDSSTGSFYGQEADADIASYNNAIGDKYIIKYYPKDPTQIYVEEARPVFLGSEIKNGEVVETSGRISRSPYQRNIAFEEKEKMYAIEYSYTANSESITKIQALPDYFNKEVLHEGDSFSLWVWRKNYKRAILLIEDEDKYIYKDN